MQIEILTEPLSRSGPMDDNEAITPLSYLQIFEHLADGRPVKRIMLKGEAGIGKSTMMHGINYIWAIYTRWELETIFKRIPINAFKWLASFQFPMNEYSVIFYVKLRMVKHNMTLCDAIYEQLLKGYSFPKKFLCVFLKSSPNKIVILFDGYDEYDPNISPEITSIIKRQSFKSALVVLSSRPGISKEFENIEIFDKIFKIAGFSIGHMLYYIQEYFALVDQELSGRELQKHLLTQTSIEQKLLKVPMMIHFICYLWYRERYFPKTTTILYKRLIQHSLYIDSFSTNTFPANFEKTQNQLSFLAVCIQNQTWMERYHEKTSSNRYTIDNMDFSNSSFIVSCPNNVQSDDMMIHTMESAEPYKLKHKLQFIHRSFQEYFIASYISKGNHTVQFIHTLLKDHLFGGHPYVYFDEFTFLQHFLCGMAESSSVLRLIIHSYLNYYSSEVKHRYPNCNWKPLFTQGLIRCFNEGNGTKGILSLIMKFNGGIIKVDDTLQQVLPTYIKQHLKNVTQFCKTSTESVSVLEYLSYCLKYFATIERLYFGLNLPHELDFHSDIKTSKVKILHVIVSDGYIQEDTLRGIFKQLKYLQNLEALSFSQNMYGHGHQLLQLLCKIGPNLKELRIDNSAMSVEDWNYVSESLHCVNNIEILSLINNTFEQKFPLATHMQPDKLKVLFLQNCTFSTISPIGFAQYLKVMQSLEHLDLTDASFSSNFDTGYTNFKYLSSLKELHLNNLSSKNLKSVLKSLKYMESLHILSLGWVNGQDDGLRMLSKFLPHLECRSCNCGAYSNLTGENFIIVQTKDIEYNFIQNIGSARMSVAYTHKSGLHVLHLNMNNVTDDGLREFSERGMYSLGACALHTLHLTVDSFPEKTFMTFAARLKHLPFLEIFSISGLTNKTAPKLAKGLKFLTQLQELNLQHSDLGDFVETLVESSFHKMKRLKHIDLSYSDISQKSLIYLHDLITALATNPQPRETCVPVHTIVLKGIQSMNKKNAFILTRRLCIDFININHHSYHKARVTILFDENIAKHLNFLLPVECKDVLFLGDLKELHRTKRNDVDS